MNRKHTCRLITLVDKYIYRWVEKITVFSDPWHSWSKYNKIYALDNCEKYRQPGDWSPPQRGVKITSNSNRDSTTQKNFFFDFIFTFECWRYDSHLLRSKWRQGKDSYKIQIFDFTDLEDRHGSLDDDMIVNLII